MWGTLLIESVFDKLVSVSPFRKTPYPTAEVGYGEGSGVDKR